VEAWNSIRALDYLCSRSEVDTNRIGTTGRSGGGAYSWWTAALDDRIKVAAPVAGITDLRNHVIDGAVEGHCDCMFMVNTYRWDYPEVAALVAPRPLLIANSDNDWIFPLDGVERLHRKVKAVYEAYGAVTNLGLLITEGPHKDTQDLQLPVFRWFNRKLKGDDPVIEMAALKLFRPEELKVFSTLPTNEITTTIQERFVPRASTNGLQPADWERKAAGWMDSLRLHVFTGWPSPQPDQLHLRFSVEHDGLLLRGIDFLSQPGVRLRLYTLRAAASEPARVQLNLLDGETNGLPALPQGTTLRWEEWANFLNAEFAEELKEERRAVTGETKLRLADFKAALQSGNTSLAFVAPRGIGLTAWSNDERTETHLRRRFMLLGQTVESMRAWDIIQSVRVLRQMLPTNAAIQLQAEGAMAVNALYASLFEHVSEVHAWNLPSSHVAGPDYLNVLRYIDIPQAVFMAQRKTGIHLHNADSKVWQPIMDLASSAGKSGKSALFLDSP